MYDKVFISYASEDLEKARELYFYLLDNRYQPWLDKEKLHVGDKWDLKIRQALKSSDFVILLLSSTSINKRGYFQREFKLALKYLEEKLSSDIYIIPILLDECDIPEQLNDIYWKRYRDENVFEKILESLDNQRKVYFKTTSQNIIDLNNSYVSERLDILPQVKKIIDCKIEFPIFSKNKFWDNILVNEAVKAKASEILNSLYNFYFSDPDYFISGKFPVLYHELNFTIVRVTESYLSVLFTEDSYLGGNHPNTYFHSLNFLFNPDYLIDPQTHFDNRDIREIVASRLFSDKSNVDSKEVCGDLSEYVQDYNFNIEFTIGEKNIELIIANNLPRIILECGFFSIPYKIDNHRIVLQLPNKQ